MSYIDVKYVSLVSNRLDKFVRKNPTLWNFRCPICGDSQKNKNKARGFIYQVKKDLFYKCHNCGYGTSFAKLLQQVDPLLYEEYLLEKYKEGETATGHQPNTCVPSPDFKKKLQVKKIGLQSFEELSNDHPAKQLFLKRMIPEKYWNLLYFAPKFYQFASRWSSNVIKKETDHPRIVIPFFDETGNFFAFQGRAFGKEVPKYVTIVMNKQTPKIYGLDRVNKKFSLQVVEGPIDSLFLSNGVAVAHGDLRIPQYKNNSVLIPDNEPRNKETCRNIEKYFHDGYKVVLWPKSIKHKDINEMIQNGMSETEIQEIINKNTHLGIEGLASFAEWKKN